MVANQDRNPVNQVPSCTPKHPVTLFTYQSLCLVDRFAYGRIITVYWIKSWSPMPEVGLLDRNDGHGYERVLQGCSCPGSWLWRTFHRSVQGIRLHKLNSHTGAERSSETHVSSRGSFQHFTGAEHDGPWGSGGKDVYNLLLLTTTGESNHPWIKSRGEKPLHFWS